MGPLSGDAVEERGVGGRETGLELDSEWTQPQWKDGPRRPRMCRRKARSRRRGLDLSSSSFLL